MCALLVAVPRPAAGWSSYKVKRYTLDISLESENEAGARLTLEIEILGGRFRGFKVARGDEGLSWSPSAMYCENSSGKRYVLRRVPRADGLTDFRFVTPGFIPRGAATCSLEYGFDPVELGAIQLVGPRDPACGHERDRVRLTYKSPGLPVAVEHFTITLHLPRDVGDDERELGEFAAEEYTVEHYPSAITLRRYRPPPYYTGLIDVVLPHEVLLAPSDGEARDEGYGLLHVDRFVGIAKTASPGGARSLWMYALLALATLVLLAAKHRGTERADRFAGVGHPYLLFPSSHVFARFCVCGVLLVLYACLAAAGRDAAAITCLAGALLFNLRSGLVLGSARGSEPGEWTQVDPPDARRGVRSSGWRESASRYFLDATTLPGLALLLASSAGLASLRYVFLAEQPAAAVRLAAGGFVVLAFVFLTSTRLGGYGHLARRSFRRLRTVLREYRRLGEDPVLCLRDDPAHPCYPEMRLRRLVAARGPYEDAVMEVGVEWRRGWRTWRPSYAVVIRLDARAGALVADAEWLDRAEVHTRLEEGLAAIVVRSLDPTLPLLVEKRVRECLRGAEPAMSAAEAVRRLGAETPTSGQGDAAPRP